MHLETEEPLKKSQSSNLTFQDDDFSRLDKTDDLLFYSKERFVHHLDEAALAIVEKLIGDLIIERDAVILDLMASWNSHLPEHLHPYRVVGLGLNKEELAANRHLSEFVIHDLNKHPRLPFPDNHFHVVVNTVSVDYMTKPLDVFGEVHRILKPGGLFLVIFSNRYFPPKVVKIWRQSTEQERVLLVEALFKAAGGFEEPKRFVSKGRPRPESDEYAHLGVPSDPIYAVYSDKAGANTTIKPRPIVRLHYGERLSPEELKVRMKRVKSTFCCPYCGERMRKWEVSQTPFTEWDNEFMYVCFNDSCPYLVRGWDVMEKQGNFGFSYRCMYNPEKDRFTPLPVPSLHAMKNGIAD